jgi:eukaryotic-like serine/threonine-protein kinase
MSAEANQRIGDYEVLGELGSGGMGKVYRVRNVISDRVEAMKVLLPDLAGRQELADRFLREIKLLASLNHPNIATLCTAQVIDNRLVMIMEYVEGVTLDDLLGEGRLSFEDGTNYIDQALSALSYAHQKGIIHRDIKPANLMLTRDRVVKVMDFGIARAGTDRGLTQTGTTLGSVNYMSPEQITGQPVDARSDIYSTGISLYEIVTGQRPFSANSDFELMAMHVKEPPKPPIELRPWLPASLNQVILTAIAKDPQQRFPTAEAFRQALRRAQGSAETAPLPTVARAATIVEPSQSIVIAGGPAMRERTQVATRGSGSQQAQAHPAALATRPATSGRKPVYIGAGAVLALAVIGAPTAYMVRNHAASVTAVDAKSGAGHGTANTTPPVVSTPPVAQPPTPARQPSVPPTTTLSVKAKAQVVVTPPPPRPEYQPTAPAAQTAGPPPMTEDLKNKLDALELRIDNDSSDSTSINNSLNTMQSQMQKDGMSLRGDVAARQASMNLNLSKAQKALEAHDADRADRFAALAESDIAQLKTFLGR